MQLQQSPQKKNRYDEIGLGLYALGVLREQELLYNKRQSLRTSARAYTKVFVVMLLVLMLGLGLSNISYTFAYYSDSEKGLGFFSARSLDIAIESTKWSRDYCQPGNPVSKKLRVQNITDHNLTYMIQAHATGGNANLCSALLIDVFRNGEHIYFGTLSDFEKEYDLSFSGEDMFDITATIPGYLDDKHIKSARCEFDFIFSSGQGMLPFGLGFYDTELDHNVVKGKVRGDNSDDDDDDGHDDDPRDPKDPKDPKDPRDPRDPREPRDPRDGIGGQEGRDGVSGQEGREGIDGQEGQDGIEGHDPHAPIDPISGEEGEEGIEGLEGLPPQAPLPPQTSEPPQAPEQLQTPVVPVF